MKLLNILKQQLNESDWASEHERLEKQTIEDWCVGSKIRNYRLEKDGREWVINVNGSVILYLDTLDIDDEGYAMIPYQFGEIEGSFTLVNKNDKMRSLKNGPYQVYDDYSAINLGLTSLEGAPGSVGNAFDVSLNKLTSWEGMPNQVGELRVAGNRIKTFTGISKYVKMCGELVFNPSEITSGALDLLKLEIDSVAMTQVAYDKTKNGSAHADYTQLIEIINSHIGDHGDKDAIELQSDLLDAGLDSWANK